MARCEQGYLCEVCGQEVEEISESDLYLRYVLGEVDPEQLHRLPERHIRCDPALGQFIVDKDFPPLIASGPFAKTALDPEFVAQEEARVTRGYLRLRQVERLSLPIHEYPLPEVRKRWEAGGEASAGEDEPAAEPASAPPEPTPRILFLDDDPWRARTFLGRHPDALWVETAEDCIARLAEAWDEVHLDHDLGGEIYVDSGRPDCGMEVVRWLCAAPREHRTETMFIIHTHNAAAAGTMLHALHEHGYQAVYRPFGVELGEWLRDEDPEQAGEDSAVPPPPSPKPSRPRNEPPWIERIRRAARDVWSALLRKPTRKTSGPGAPVSPPADADADSGEDLVDDSPSAA